MIGNRRPRKIKRPPILGRHHLHRARIANVHLRTRSLQRSYLDTCSLHHRNQTVDVLRPRHGLIALNVQINVRRNRRRNFMHPLGTRPMRRRRHARDEALLFTEPQNFIRIGSDKHLGDRRTTPHTPIHPSQQRNARDLPQHLARQPRRGQTRWNHSDDFHPPSFARGPAV